MKRTATGLVLGLTVALTFFVPARPSDAAAQPTGAQRIGDVDCNGAVTANDALLVVDYLASLNGGAPSCADVAILGPNLSRADIDLDGLITTRDALIISQCAAGIDLAACPVPIQIPVTAPFDPTSPAMGDVNCDGQRTIADAVLIGSMLGGATAPVDECLPFEAGEANLSRADVNGDGLVTAADAELVAACIAVPDGAGCPAISCGAADADVAACVDENRILSIRFLPRDPAEPEMLDPWALLDGEVADNVRKPVADILAHIEASEAAGVTLIEESTRYRGWEDPLAPTAVALSIVEEITLYERPPLGLIYIDTPRPDYDQILSRPDIDVCDWVDNQNIDEIWMWSMHTERITPVESNMSSRVGLPFIDISNSERTDDLPHCARTYVLYNFNFTAGEPNMLHNRGHHMEALSGYWFGDSQAFSYDGYVGQGFSYETLVAPLGFYRCGNVHRALNSPAIALPGQPEENWWVNRTVQSDCENWARSGGTPEAINCANWYEPYYGDPTCFDDGGEAWYVYWFQNMPGIANGMVDEGGQWRNVHQAIADPDSVLTATSHLYETEELRSLGDGAVARRGGHDGHHHIDHVLPVPEQAD